MLAGGKMLGPYEIRSPLGAGGMGEVYRAHDKRLRRDVAIKVLPATLLADDTHRRRFAQEAQAASALNHPNILSVFDVSLDSDPPYIVSELVEGESLHAAIGQRPMGLKKLLDLAVQIADGLSAAHQAGIVHRDLKPGNVMVTRDGRAKILDFGLARQLSGASIGEDAATVPLSLTDAGKVVGTVQYMSPEQARGRAVDARSDIFSFGVILYEMASGARPFHAGSSVEILAAIIREDPAPLDPLLPLPLRWTIDRCLAKEPDGRYQSTRDLYANLRQVRDHLGDVRTGSAVTVAPRAGRARRWLWWAAAAAALLVAGLAAVLVEGRKQPPIEANQFRPLATGSVRQGYGAWSPDGQSIAYQAQIDGIFQVFTRALESSAPLQITNCPKDCTRPEWSPDGSRLFFLMDRSVWSAGAAGGQMDTVMQDVDEVFSLSRKGDALAFVRRERSPPRLGVWISSPPGAAPVRYTPAPFEGEHSNSVWLAFAPDGRQLLYWVGMVGPERRSEYWLLPFPAGPVKPRQVLTSLRNSYPVRGFSWMPDSRRIVLACAAAPDPFRSHLYMAEIRSGEFRPLVVGIGSEAEPNVSTDGAKLVYSAMESITDIVEIPLDGSAMRVLMFSKRLERNPAWAPRRHELVYVTDRNGADEIWITTLEQGWDKPLITPRSFRDGLAPPVHSPVFSPDGQRIAFVRNYRIWIASVAGGAPIPLGSFGASDQAPTWSPDGNWIAFNAVARGLMKARVGGQEAPILLHGEPEINFRVNYGVPDWSPRGDSIAWPTDKGTALISADGQSERILRSPAFRATGWSADGATLYGLTSQDGKQVIVAVDIATGREKPISRLAPPVSISDVWATTLRLSVSPDGKGLATTARRNSSDIWMLEHFDAGPSLLQRLGWHR
jgi:Tol biopolymer transport system component